MSTSRRSVLGTGAAISLALAAGACVVAKAPVRHAAGPRPDVAPFRTPYKYHRLVLDKSGVDGSFDARGVDTPFVFSVGGTFYMTYLGFDSIGYQTGLARSDDLVNWTRQGVILARDPLSKYTRYNIALTSILRDDALTGTGQLKQINGQYVGTWHAYPKAGYEQGAAVIGLAWSNDLRTWKVSEPILRPEDGAPWERGGYYRSYLVEDAGTYHYSATCIGHRIEGPFSSEGSRGSSA